ncbi:MAG: EamA family transporter [Acidilobus sp.]
MRASEAALLVMAISVGVAFGVHDAVAKLKMEGVEPSSLSLATLMAGLPLLSAALPFAGGLRLTPLAGLLYVSAGVVNFALGRTTMYAATTELTASGASVMTASSAAFSVLIGAAIGERVTWDIALGVATIIIAVYLASGWSAREVTKRGVALGLLTGLAIALSVAIIKLGDLMGGSPGLGVIIAYLSGTLALSPKLRSATSTLRSYLVPVGVMGVAAAAGQLMRYLALTSLGVNVVTPLQNLRPIVATMMLYGLASGGTKRPRLRHWAGAVLAFVGVALVSGLV